MKNKVSIIVPIYNTAKYLPDCLDSILNQTHQNLEIILVDDGSTDDSAKIVDRYARKDKRIKAVHQKNAGQSAARNCGLKLATGNYISFVDSDDEIAPSFIEDLLESYKKDISFPVCGIRYNRLRANSTKDVSINPLRPKRKNESFKAYILYIYTIDSRLYPVLNKLFRADIAKQIQFDESINFAEDSKFVLDYLSKSPGEFAFVLKPSYIYNFGTSTSTMMSASTNWKNWQNQYRMYKDWLGPHPSFMEKFWLHALHLRWRISYLRSKRRAKQ